MKILKVAFLVLLISVTFQCKDTKKEMNNATGDMDTEQEMDGMMDKVQEQEKTLQFSLEPKSNSKVEGVVNFTEVAGSVTMTATLKGLEQGDHAIHIHEKADCSAADGASAGGHWNPTNEPHGKWGAEAGYHRGDIGNFTADTQGNATVTFSTGEWCIGCDDANKNILSKAVIVHQGVDDFTTQPSGDAGARVSCTGIIE